MRTIRRSWSSAVAAIVVAGVLASGCGLTDPGSAVLPGGVASGGDGYRVTAEFESVSNLVPNSSVMFNDVTIGTVRSIDLDRRTWRARVVLSLDRDVDLPADVTASVAQKSLLGAEYVELAAPGEPSTALLEPAAVIPASRTNRYPEVDELLSALSLLLNNGGLDKIRSITAELHDALGGRSADVRSLLDRLDVFVGSLAGQRSTIKETIQHINRLSRTFAQESETVRDALEGITPAVARLERERPDIVRALRAVDEFAVVAERVVTESRAGLAANLESLRPVLGKLAEAGDSVPDSLPIALSFPFPVTTLERAAPGDYLNAFLTFDFRLGTLQRDLLGQVPLVGGLPLGAALDANDPTTAPLTTPPAGKDAAKGSAPKPPAATSPEPRATEPPAAPCGLLGQLLGSCT